MDLFVAHQALFPLAPGRIVIPPATVAYAVPVGFSVFKREERYSLRSDTVPVTVLPLPAARRPADDQPVVGQRSEEHTSELQSRENLVCRLLLEKKKKKKKKHKHTNK